MTASVVLFTLAALGGAFLAIQRLRGRDLPMPVAVVHGVLAAAGLAALALSFASGQGGAKLPLGLFVVAALGGFMLFAMHLRKATLPVPLVLVHGVVAVFGFALLVAGLTR